MTGDAQLAEYYRKLYATTASQIISMETLITPAMAQGWLARNKGNRPLALQTVARYVRAIRLREWVVNGEPVILDRDENLLDGQHRLEAIIRVGFPLPVMVTWGVDPAAFTTLNTGKTRSLADVLEIKGETKCKALASCARWLHSYMAGSMMSHGSNAKPSHAQLLDVIAENPGLKDSLSLISPLCQRGKHPPSVFAFLYYVCNLNHPDRAFDFYNRVLTGADLKIETPEHTLSRVLGDDVKSVFWQSQTGRTEMIALCIKAWNFFIAGEPCKLLRWQRGPGKFPTIR